MLNKNAKEYVPSKVNALQILLTEASRLSDSYSHLFSPNSATRELCWGNHQGICYSQASLNPRLSQLPRLTQRFFCILKIIIPLVRPSITNNFLHFNMEMHQSKFQRKTKIAFKQIDSNYALSSLLKIIYYLIHLFPFLHLVSDSCFQNYAD